MLNRKNSVETLDYDLPNNCTFNSCESGLMLNWNEIPNKILVVRKDSILKTINFFYKQVICWLLKNYSTEIYIEEDFIDNLIYQLNTQNKYNFIDKIKGFSENDCTDIDLIITIGGDSNLKKASGYFKTICPPIMAFNLGTLGFMAPYDMGNYKDSLTKTLKGSIPCVLRNRLCFNISHLNEPNSTVVTNRKSECYDNIALNDIVIDRGASNHILSLVIDVDNKFVTKMSGDGLIISTPTGSTAYSLAAGASIIHPSVRAVLVTPINAFSLSMRPILLPVGIYLKIYLDPNARAEIAHISIDGNNRQVTISKAQCVNIFVSRYPVISMCRTDQKEDWFQALNTGLYWNRNNEKQG